MTIKEIVNKYDRIQDKITDSLNEIEVLKFELMNKKNTPKTRNIISIFEDTIDQVGGIIDANGYELHEEDK